MESVNIASFLQEASISIFTVSALVYIVYIFIKYIERQSASHGKTLDVQEKAFRDLEREMRTMLKEHIQQSNQALRDNTKALEHNAEVNERIMRLK